MRSLAKILSVALLLGVGSLALGAPRTVPERRGERRLSAVVMPTSPISLDRQFGERLLLLASLVAGDEVPAGTPYTISDVPDPIGSKPTTPPITDEPADPRAAADEDQGTDRRFAPGP